MSINSGNKFYNMNRNRAKNKRRPFSNNILVEFTILVLAISVVTAVIYGKKNKNNSNIKSQEIIDPFDAEDSTIGLDEKPYESTVNEVKTKNETKNETENKAEEHILSSYVTKINSSKLKEKNRLHNIKKAVSFINNVTLKPGEEFSFHNKTWAGNKQYSYKKADNFTPHGMDKGIGGGMCQVSTTLYIAAIFANLKITQRMPHSRQVDYGLKGLDAAYETGVKDLKFVNSNPYPITIKAVATNDFVRVQILGNVDSDVKVTVSPAKVKNLSNRIKTNVRVKVEEKNKDPKYYNIESVYFKK